MASVHDAIREAESLLPGRAAPEGEKDPRWQALIRVGEHLPTQPEVIWPFIKHWGAYPDDDLSDAVACCLLEHLLEEHFQTYFPMVAELARSEARFSRTVLMCWPFGETEQPYNRNQFERLKDELRQSKRLANQALQPTPSGPRARPGRFPRSVVSCASAARLNAKPSDGTPAR